MPANVGEMFYTGEMPWHGRGIALAQPATMEEALRAGGLNWEVGFVDLLTADNPPSPVPMRKAIVRRDRPAGDPRRVLGVAHRGFQPLQNKDGALLFDAIFGQGRQIYHTGGYLGNGEVVWLLAKMDKPKEIAPNDIVEPYALFANSHDGSMAFHIRLTTIRVVCQNTLALAIKEPGFEKPFRRSHHGSFLEHAAAAQKYIGAALGQFAQVTEEFTSLTRKSCSADKCQQFLKQLLPEPTRPRNAERNPGLLRIWENKVAEIRAAQRKITDLLESGKGMDLPGSRGTFWGVLNAVLEFVDHHQKEERDSWAYALMGEGMDLTVRAFQLIRSAAQAA